MRAQEFLRRLADMLDSQEAAENAPSTDNIVNRPELEPMAVDNTDDTEIDSMIPPLQQKLELLKKSVGVTSAFDGEEASNENAPDELAIIKKSAGLSPIGFDSIDTDADI